ncbi:DUF433 domain-containing protein [Luteolibacter sp. Populi]|uniref:DUF433 domain-containing protein n=1 Tax=Luteolibacter sp. Populi TaxID=3230487 RepID=UPI0034671476
MELSERITIEPGKCGGRPFIRGRGVPVSEILEFIDSGASNLEILEEFPDLEAEDIMAAMAYVPPGPEPKVE